MSSGHYPLYRHSGKFTPHGLLLALLVPALAAYPLGFVYSYAIKWIPLVYLNFLITAGYGFVFGFLSGWLMKIFAVRNNVLALLAGLAAGAFALYFNWNGHIHALVDGAPLFLWPDQILGIMKLLYENGSWGLMSGGNLTGFALGIVWAVEAVMIIGISTLIAYTMIDKVPFCEQSKCWLEEKKDINSMEAFSDPASVAALKAGDLGALSQIRGKVAGSSPFGRLTIKHSDKCDEFCTLTVSNVTITVDKEGSPKETAQELVSNLVLPKPMMNYLKGFEHLKPGLTLEAP